MQDELDEVDGLYIANALLSDACAPVSPLCIADIVRFLTVSGTRLTAEQSRKLVADRALRQVYARLKAVLVSHEMPALIAASDGEVDERTFEGGTLLLVRGDAGDWYMRVRIDQRGQTEKLSLLIEPEGGLPRKIDLGMPDSTRSYLVLLDDTDAHDQAVIVALRDPLSRAYILSTGGEG